MALNPRAKMLAAIAATKQNQPTSGGPSGQGETLSNPPSAPTAGPSKPSGEPVQPTALGTAALLDKANQAVTEALQKQGPVESVKVSVPSLNRYLSVLSAHITMLITRSSKLFSSKSALPRTSAVTLMSVSSGICFEAQKALPCKLKVLQIQTGPVGVGFRI